MTFLLLSELSQVMRRLQEHFADVIDLDMDSIRSSSVLEELPSSPPYPSSPYAVDQLETDESGDDTSRAESEEEENYIEEVPRSRIQVNTFPRPHPT